MNRNEKYWSGLNTFFDQYIIYIFLRICRFTNPVSRSEIVLFFICFLTFGSIFLLRVVFIPETLSLFFVTDSSFTCLSWLIYTNNFFTWFAQRFWVLAFPLKGLIFNILNVYNNILLKVLIRNAFPAPLLLVCGNKLFFIGTPFWTNVLESLQDWNAFIFVVALLLLVL